MPYDVVNTAEARHLAADNPYSFLHVVRSEIDLPPDTDPFDPSVYARAADRFGQFIQAFLGDLPSIPVPFDDDLRWLAALLANGHGQIAGKRGLDV